MTGWGKAADVSIPRAGADDGGTGRAARRPASRPAVIGLCRALLASAALGAWVPGVARATDLDIAYGPDPAQRLDVCTPEKAGANRPAVLLLHGGSWQKGSRLGLEHRCSAFMAHGIVAVPVDYRLADGSAAKAWPVQLQDAQGALRWLRAHAATYRIDPGHICAYGESAGGQLALLLGEAAPASALPGPAEAPPRADCVISNAGPADLTGLASVHPDTARAVLGPVDQAQASAELAAASPLDHVTKAMPPTLLIQGQNDRLVPPGQALQMLAALRQAGVPAWLITHSGAHVFSGITKPEAGAIWREVIAFVKQRNWPGQPAQTAAKDLEKK